MENNNMMELVESIVKDRIKQRDGYKLTGVALGTMLVNALYGYITVDGEWSDWFGVLSIYTTFFYCGMLIFLGSLINNIAKLYKYRKESISGRVKQVLEMIVTIFYSCVTSMLLWFSFFEYFSMG